MGSQSKWPLVIFNCSLAFTSYWALKSTAWFMRYARGAERIHFITGVVATVVYSVPQKEGVYDLLKQLYIWYHVLSPSLIASEIYVRSGYVPDIAPLHLAVPLFVLAHYYLSGRSLDLDMMSIGQGLALFSMGAASLSTQNIPGILITVLCLNFCFRDPSYADESSSFALLGCFINILLPDALFWNFHRRNSSE